MSGEVKALARGLVRLWSVLVAGVLLTALTLGFLASHGSVDRTSTG